MPEQKEDKKQTTYNVDEWNDAHNKMQQMLEDDILEALGGKGQTQDHMKEKPEEKAKEDKKEEKE